MTGPININDTGSGPDTTRTALRVSGGVLVLVGLILVVIGMSEFFSSQGPPQHFFLLFIGLPLLGVGSWLLQAGFAGAIGLYAARQSAPAIRTVMGAVRADAQPPAPPAPRAATGPTAYCTTCGTPAPAVGRFCGGCGTELS